MSSLQKANPCELFESFVKKRHLESIQLIFNIFYKKMARPLGFFFIFIAAHSGPQEHSLPTGMIWVIKQRKCLSLLFLSISEWSAKLSIVSIY